MALVAESQYGLLTLNQALRCGATYRMIRRSIASDRWIAEHESAYRMAGVPRCWRQKVLAAVLAVGPGAVVSHRAAARLWELDCSTDPMVELSVARPRFHRVTDTIVHRSTDLARSPLRAGSVSP